MSMNLLLTSFWGNIMCPCHLQKQCFITIFSRFWLLIKTFPFFLPFVFPAPFVPLRSSDDNYAKKESHPYPKTSIFYWWVPCDLFLFIFRCGLITGTQSSPWGETIKYLFYQCSEYIMSMNLLLTSFWGNMCPYHLQKWCFISKFCNPVCSSKHSLSFCHSFSLPENEWEWR